MSSRIGLTALLFLSACGGSSTADSGEPVCSPGDTQPCDALGEDEVCDGVQVCARNGSRWLECACPGDGEPDPIGTGDGDGDGDGDNGGASSGVGGNAEETGGTAGTGGDGSGGMTMVGSGGTGGGPNTCTAQASGSSPLIDDLEHLGSAEIPEVDSRVGSWFLSNDGTPGAEQTPESDMVFPEASVGYAGAGFHSTATGFADPTAPSGPWGASFGLSFLASCPYDASAHDGVSFWARSGDGEEHTLRFALSTADVVPTSRGGVCSGVGCDDSHHTTIIVEGSWQLFEVAWGDVAQDAGWQHDNKVEFDPSVLMQLIWWSQAGEYDVVVDDVSFFEE